MKTESEKTICFFCNEQGHTIGDCQTLKQLVCPICKEKGHTKRKCPNFDPQYTSKLECGYCRSKNKPCTGHTKRNCRDLLAVVCNLCDEKGHEEKWCPQFNRQNKGKSVQALEHLDIPVTPPKSDFPTLPKYPCAPSKPIPGWTFTPESPTKPFVGCRKRTQHVLGYLSNDCRLWFEKVMRNYPFPAALDELVELSFVVENNPLDNVKQEIKKEVVKEPLDNVKQEIKKVVVKEPLDNVKQEIKKEVVEEKSVKNKCENKFTINDFSDVTNFGEIFDNMQKEANDSIPDTWDD